jgi:predicted dehydrogenase
MLEVAIIGCGKIADSHAAQIQRIEGCRIAGVCDSEILLARQLAERFGVARCFADAEELLDACRPDVVHITTPPLSHLPLGKLCLEAGCHVYIEKPFTLNAAEAEMVIALADEKGLKITAGHNAQFTHAARRIRRLIHDGYLGGPPVHMESTWCYDLTNPSYARAVLGDKRHWLRGLPGKLLQNIVSHGIARLAEFLPGEAVQVSTLGFTSPMLRSLKEDDIVDELRTIITDGDRTAYFTFSSQMRPSRHDFRVYGPRNSLVMDEDQQTVIKLGGARYKSYAETFIPPLNLAKQYVGNWMHNAGLFLRNDFHPDASKKFLFESFYQSIVAGTPPPIPYREILLTTQIMDTIFAQLSESRIEAAAACVAG